MIITYNTCESFKVQFGDTVISLNPVSKKSKYSTTNFGAYIACSTLHNPDMNGFETVARGEKEPFIIEGPGEYEVADIFIRGFLSHSLYGGEERFNTIYLVNVEDMILCFLGALTEPTVPGELKEELESIDILFIPIGGDGVLTPHDAHKLSVSLESHIIIPMHYSKETLEAFLKEEGAGSAAVLEKLTIKKKEVLEKEGEIIVLKETAL